MTDQSQPIGIDVKSAAEGNTAASSSIRTFTSYNFDRNMLTPASPFRFMAPGVTKSVRTGIRSSDLVTIWGIGPNGDKQQIGTGIIDETDTNVTSSSIEYNLTGRDTLGQMVDNSAIDANNKIINIENVSIIAILDALIANTRIPKGRKQQGVPNGKMLFQTNTSETKISALQRYLEFSNCLVWTTPQGQVVIGKPNFHQPAMGSLYNLQSDPSKNNVIECRVRRNTNTAIRQIVTQLQSLNQVDAGVYTVRNQDRDVKKVAKSLGGRSVYRLFNYGQGNDTINQITQVGNSSGSPSQIGQALSLREIARENMKVLEVEAVVRGHFNENGLVYNIDQIYNVQIEADDVSEDMYVHSCSYEMTMDHGMLTRLRLCRLGAICADAAAIARSNG